MRSFGLSIGQVRRGLVFAALAVLCAAAGEAAHAQKIYRWVDEKGEIHYSNDPAHSSKGSSVAVPGKSGSPQAPEAKASGPTYTGSRPSRPIRLEEVVVRLEVDSEKVIGHIGSGPDCEPRKELVASPGKEFVAPFDLPARFAERARQLGYQVASDPTTGSGIRVFASIKSLEVRECEEFGRRKQGAFVRVRKRHRVALNVDWELFDGRALEERWSSFGRFSDLGGTGGSTLEKAFAEAFRDATDRLFEAPAIALLLGGEGGAAAAPSLPAKLDFTWSGSEPSTFQGRIASLKAGTVTIRTRAGHGSGFLVSKAGHVLTNWHVVRGESRATVVFQGGELPAEIVAGDPKRDVALLRVAGAPSVAPLTLSSAPVTTGETVYVIGTPLDESLSHTVTRGILSAERKIDGQRLYQTDAAVNPGNSGGPALNERGDVIGLTVSGAFTDSGAPLDIAFLIPIEDALAALGQPPASPAP